MFERPAVLWLLVAAPLVAGPSLLTFGAGRRLTGVLAAALRLLCFASLVLGLAGMRLPQRGTAHGFSVVALLDQSSSIASDQRAWMTDQLNRLRHAMMPGDRLAVIGFGRDTRLLAPPSDPRLLRLDRELVPDPGATDIQGALVTAAGLFSGAREKRILLLSDGNQTQGDALEELAPLASGGVRIYSAAPPAARQPRVAITSFAAPSVVRTGASFALHLDIVSEAPTPAPALIKLFADDRPVGYRQLTLGPGINRLQMPFSVARPGAYMMKATVTVASPLVASNPSAATALAVSAPPRVLMVSENPAESLVQVLKLRGYQVDTAAPHGLPRRAEDYLGYQAVIIMNTSAAAIDEEAQQALNRYVADFSGGVIVGGDTLRDMRFHDGPLEKALPIEFVPQPPPPSREPIAIYLLIDRSNSMSYNSRYPAVRDGERIRYAKQAAAALLNQLDDTDYAGVIAFDSEPYVLGHLRPLGQDRAPLLDRIRRLEPGGGTDFKDGLELAEQEILASGIGVREVILLTDGDTNRQYHDHDQLMADYVRHQIPLSTIRIGPDLENLRLLQDFAQMTGGVFYRVEDITRLPQLLVHLTNEARNFQQRERPEVEAAVPSAVLSGIDPHEVPPIEFFALTRAKDEAEVPLMVRKGASRTPLLVTWQYELGRTAVFAGDPDSMGSLAWLRWDHYAEFWSQLVSWVAREGDPGLFSLRVNNRPDGALEIEAEKANPGPVGNLFCRVAGSHQVEDIALSQTSESVYRGESAPLRAGKYNLVLMIKAGDTEQVLLRREIAAPGAARADAEELKLKPTNDGLLRQLAQGTGGAYQPSLKQILTPSSQPVTTWYPIDSLLFELAVILLLGDVLVRRRFLNE
jgi:Ca-activated chloride channel homolog